MIISKHKSAHFALLSCHGTFKVNYRIRFQHPAWHSQSPSTWPHWVLPFHIPSSPSVHLTFWSLYDTFHSCRSFMYGLVCVPLLISFPPSPSLTLRTVQGQFKELHSGKHSLSPVRLAVNHWVWRLGLSLFKGSAQTLTQKIMTG